MEKYDFKKIEDKVKNLWQKEGIFAFDENSDKPLYVVDTPPPYVSADHLHAGHIMSYTQAEFIVRYKRMQGFNVYYPMGFDDNGLPTERFVEKKYNLNKDKITRSEFIKLCLQETKLGSKTYKDLWNALGISVDWSKTYSTIDKNAQKVSQKSLIDINNKGGLYRKSEPLLWCVSCQTALAQADLEDEVMDGKLNYIDFDSEGSKLTIATTRPELLPACVALYVNPKDKRYSKFIGKKANVPLFNYSVEIKTSEKVDPEYGTGLMMVCTWGDQEDVEKWKEDNLDERNLFSENGRLTEIAGDYSGMKILEARKEIISKLQDEGFLVKQEEVSRSVSVHERCSTPVEFIKSKQWFIKVANLKKEWITQGKKLNWYPEDRINDYELWVNNLKWDWCISRQRFYGVPLPIWNCEDCEGSIFAEESQLPVNPIEDKPPVNKCPDCGSTNIKGDEDVMDTWATSSTTPEIIRELISGPLKDKVYPATLRPNAFEIIRTWDFYSIVKGHYNNNTIPFKDVMISGHGLDQKGHKFSKRLGNYKPAKDLVDNFGADAIRYWATGALLGQNLRFSDSEVNIGHKTAMKLYNVANMIEFYKIDKTPDIKHSQLEDSDKWILENLNTVIETATKAFDNYSYAKARSITDDFFWAKFADLYLEFIKYRLNGENETSKKAAQWTLRTVYLNILKLYAPLLPFITEEVYLHTFLNEEKDISIHISSWPKELKIENKSNIKDFNSAIEAINEVRKYKSENNISLGKELDEFTLTSKLDKKYYEFVSKAIKVINLK